MNSHRHIAASANAVIATVAASTTIVRRVSSFPLPQMPKRFDVRIDARTVHGADAVQRALDEIARLVQIKFIGECLSAFEMFDQFVRKLTRRSLLTLVPHFDRIAINLRRGQLQACFRLPQTPSFTRQR